MAWFFPDGFLLISPGEIMYYSIRNQYEIITKNQGFETDFRAMYDWFNLLNIRPCKSEYFGEEINSVLVKRWIEYRNSLTNTQNFDRAYLEGQVRSMCEPEDYDDLVDSFNTLSDGHLIALARLFPPKLIESPDSISISWSIDDVKHICPQVTDQQAKDVLQYVKEHHNADIGINWDVIDSAIDKVLPELVQNEVNSAGNSNTSS